VYLTNLASICRAAGLRVVEVRGWRTRGHGPLTAVRTIVCHHTAGAATGNMPSLGTITNGRPGLDGPLANLGLARDGTVYVVAAGLAYHAGQVRNASYANAYSIGIEGEGTGAAPWPAVQIRAYATLCAALVKAYRLTPARVLGHKEVCYPVGRKTDPNFAMAPFRTRVSSLLKAPPPAQEAPVATADEIFTAVWKLDRIKGPMITAANPTWTAEQVLVYSYAHGLTAIDEAKAARANSAAAQTESAAAHAGATRLEAAVATLTATMAKVAADVAQTKAAVARIEATLAGIGAIPQQAGDAVRQALADATVKVDVTVAGNVRPASP
jgi:hypothetical protein